jgi:hypothetical protein
MRKDFTVSNCGFQSQNKETTSERLKLTKKMMGVVSFWVVRTAEHIQTGEKVVRRWGPYRTNEEAEMKKLEDEEAAAVLDGYEYTYRIETAPTIPGSK